MKLKVASHSALIAMLNIPVTEGQTETAELTEAQMDNLNAAVEALQGKLSTANESINALTTEKDTLTASLKTATDALAPVQAEVKRLKVFEPKSTVVNQTAGAASVHNDADMDTINNLPHNKALDGNPLFN